MPLHIEKELNAMLDRGFSPELVEKLVACRQARWKARGHIDNEKREPLLWAALIPLLTPQQKDTLEAIQAGRRQIYPLLAKFAFHNGLLTGFQQHFSPEPLTSAFLELVNHQVLERTHLCPPYQRAKEENNALSEQLARNWRTPPRTCGSNWTCCGRTWSMAWPWRPSTWGTGRPCTPSRPPSATTR